MTSIYYVLVLLPVTIITVMSFAFASSVAELSNKQFLLNCPYPIFNGVASNLTIVGSTLDYDITYGVGNNASGTFFVCFIDNITQQKSAFTSVKPYGATAFNTIPYGWYSWFGDTVAHFFDKIIPFISMIYLIVNAPAQIMALSWYSYANLFFVFCIAIGIFLMIRG